MRKRTNPADDPQEGQEGMDAGMFSGGSQPAASLTPMDVQNKEFRVARMGGYRMRDVDEFLDQVTESLGALLAENERLRSGAATAPDGERGEADRIVQDARREAERIVADARSQAGAAGPSPEGRDVRTFLKKEQDFLRSLGALVQDHAEQMKELARSSRTAPAPPPTPSEEIGAHAEPEASDEGSGPDAAARRPAMVDEAGEPAHDPEATEAMSREELGVGADDPIVVADREPAATRRAEERRSDGSLRELFWGEEG